MKRSRAVIALSTVAIVASSLAPRPVRAETEGGCYWDGFYYCCDYNMVPGQQCEDSHESSWCYNNGFDYWTECHDGVPNSYTCCG